MLQLHTQTDQPTSRSMFIHLDGEINKYIRGFQFGLQPSEQFELTVSRVCSVALI